jgi:hypothetical protein
MDLMRRFARSGSGSPRMIRALSEWRSLTVLAPMREAPLVMTMILPLKKSAWVEELKVGGMKRVVVIEGVVGVDCDEGWRVWTGVNGFFAFDFALMGSMLIVGGRLQKVFDDGRDCCFSGLIRVSGFRSSMIGVGESIVPFTMPLAVEIRFAFFFRFAFSNGA